MNLVIMLRFMAGLVWEIPAGLVWTNEGGEVVSDVYLATQFGEFSWTGAQVSVTRYKSDGTSEQVTIDPPTEQNLQDIYESSPAFKDIISPPDAYAGPPWAP